MAGNSIGTIFKLTTFGESHGEYIGGVLDGCPSNITIDMDIINHDLLRRNPKTFFSTARIETDQVEIISGIFDGKTLGTPIAFLIKNTAQRSEDYEILKHCFRPSHADYTYQTKYGIRDYRGGGRASARETAARVVAGSIAKQILQQHGITIFAFTSAIGKIEVDKDYKMLDLNLRDTNALYCPDSDKVQDMQTHLKEVADNDDSVGGIITCVIKGCPVGLGEPVFDKLQADLAKAMMSIPSAKGFEYGDGFEMAKMYGSQCLDIFNNDLSLQSNHSGGIQGGISNGEDIFFRVAFKPIASLGMSIPLTHEDGNSETRKIGGRHDVCQVPRAVPIVEAMAAITILDKMLIAQCYH